MSDRKVSIVVDGGCLVQKVGWPKNATFDCIAENYVTFKKKML